MYEHSARVTGCCQYTEQRREEVKHHRFHMETSDGVTTARCEHSMMTRLTSCKRERRFATNGPEPYKKRVTTISPTCDHLVQVARKKPTAGNLFEWFSTGQIAAPSRFTDIFGILTHNINWLLVCCIMYM